MAECNLLEAFEVHSPEGIKKALADGVSPVETIKGRHIARWFFTSLQC
jgi:hypothetical protein